MDNSKFLGALFDQKMLSILTHFLENKNSNLYLREISVITKVPVATTFRILKKLTDLEIIKLNQINRFKFYQLNDNERVAQLSALISKNPVDRFVSKIKGVEGVESVLLYAEKTTSANLLIIGTKLDSEKIEVAIKDVKIEFNFMVRYATSTAKRFEQQLSMGMISQPKKVLWKSI